MVGVVATPGQAEVDGHRTARPSPAPCFAGTEDARRRANVPQMLARISDEVVGTRWSGMLVAVQRRTTKWNGGSIYLVYKAGAEQGWGASSWTVVFLIGHRAGHG